METELLIAHGNTCREQRKPEEALKYYAQALIQDHASVAAWNNYGNVIREIGYPERSIPFLEHALRLDPNHSTAAFNLAVSYLLMGDYQRGWPQYESRWNYEHLAGTLPNLPRPRWTGQDIQGKTVLMVGEQGLGDSIQFSRFAYDLNQRGARVIMAVPTGLVPLFQGGVISQTIGLSDPIPEFDYWVPVMSIPAVVGCTLDNLARSNFYITPNRDLITKWRDRLGPKSGLRVGFCWSGRRDSWINQHKSMPFDTMMHLVKKNPQYEWINLQVDADEEQNATMRSMGLKLYPGTITNMSDTAALIANLDVVISVDTAVAHLSGALGMNTWVMLNQFAVDWRWGLNRDDCPWYPTVKLFRQPKMDDWDSVINKVDRWLDLFKI